MPRRLRQVVLNLVVNAVKFTSAGSVQLKAVFDSAGNEPELHCEVRDTGIGIAPADQARLFLHFEQADSSISRRFGGTGLGLAIVRPLVRLMGGDIGVTCAVDARSTFRFSARLGWAQGAAAGAKDAVPASEERLRASHPGLFVLMAEDEPINQEVSGALLEHAGCRVHMVADRAAAAATRCDLILMDLQMPVMDGLEAARRMRAGARNRETPIDAATANTFDHELEACRDAGMDGHVAKPIDPEQLFERILRALEQRAGS